QRSRSAGTWSTCSSRQLERPERPVLGPQAGSQQFHLIFARCVEAVVTALITSMAMFPLSFASMPRLAQHRSRTLIRRCLPGVVGLAVIASTSACMPDVDRNE